VDTGKGVALVNNRQLHNNNKDHIKCFNCGVMGHYANQSNKASNYEKDNDQDTGNDGGSQG